MEELILVINSGKCAWGKCLFCGWGCAERREKSLRELKEFLDSRLKRARPTWLKIFNSGSFFDEKQIPKAFRSYVVRKAELLGIKNIVVESLPQFVTEENIRDMKSQKVKVHVAIGLEVADDAVLRKLGKSVTNKKNYVKAAGVLHENGFYLRTYLIANPPYVKNIRKSLKDSVTFANKHSDTVAICNLYPHSKSGLFDMWMKGKWAPLGRDDFDKVVKGLKAEVFFDNFVFSPRWPRDKQIKIKGAGLKQLLHPYFEVWQDFICKFHKVPEDKKDVLFIPCAYRKPYWSSKLHKAIASVIKRKDLHLVVLSSPGVVPIELCNNYPFNSYDWPEWEETKSVKKKYIEVTQKRVENFLRSHKYKKYYCYFKPSSESYKALVKACDKVGVKLVSCVDEKTYETVKNVSNPLTLPEMLDCLRVCMKN